MSRCKSYFCNGFVDFTIDERGELCPQCMMTIFEDLPEKMSKKVEQKLDKLISESLRSIDD